MGNKKERYGKTTFESVDDEECRLQKRNKKMKEFKKISITLIIVSIIINFVNSIFFCEPGLTCINPFYSMFFFLYFLAGVLGKSIFSIIFAGIFSAAYILTKKCKEKFWYYFAILFLIFSLFFLYISYKMQSL